MAQAQRKPPVRDERERTIEQLREATETIRRGGFSEPQRERIRQFLDQMTQLMQQMQTQQQGQSQPQGQRPAPRRIENYVVTIGTGATARAYRVTMPGPLTAGREREELLRMAHNHEFWERGPSGPERVTSPATPAPRAQVEQLSGPGISEFNRAGQSARVDSFETALNRARETSMPVTVASYSPAPARRGG